MRTLVHFLKNRINKNMIANLCYTRTSNQDGGGKKTIKKTSKKDEAGKKAIFQNCNILLLNIITLKQVLEVIFHV